MRFLLNPMIQNLLDGSPCGPSLQSPKKSERSSKTVLYCYL
jgi:hypothetical protein